MLKWILAVTMLVAVPAASHAQDVKKGKKVFRKCAACHKVGPKAKHLIGPQLNGLLDRAAGKAEGFKYSKPMADSGLTWDADTLAAFLKKPKDKVPGTKMIFAGLKKEKDRVNLIAYLSSFAADGSEKK